MDGDSLFALAKSSLTRKAPMPTYNSTNSLAEQLINGTSASPATAFANRVLPVPGRPSCKINQQIFTAYHSIQNNVKIHQIT